MPDSLFDLDPAGRLLPSELTRGGWSDDAQHGSPPSGVLARAIEMVPTSAPMIVARLTIDLFRAVPLVPLVVETNVLRDGRRIQVVEARLVAEDVEVGRAVALKIRQSSVDLPGAGNAGEEVFEPGPDELSELDWADQFGLTSDLTRFHTDAVEIRSVDRSFATGQRGRSWFRLRYPLVAGEELTPFQRVATMADVSNGNSSALDPREWLFVNPDITIYLHRLPVGEWVAMDSVSRQSPDGHGVTDTLLFDTSGPIGRVLQAQLLDRR